MSRFLDASAIGTNGATLVVNGVEMNNLSVSASAIQQIKINQDPYSAEYPRPGRGRIEVVLKPGSQEYHGVANIIFRDSALNARNAFATVKPDEQRRASKAFSAARSPIPRKPRLPLLCARPPMTSRPSCSRKAHLVRFNRTCLHRTATCSRRGPSTISAAITRRCRSRSRIRINRRFLRTSEASHFPQQDPTGAFRSGASPTASRRSSSQPLNQIRLFYGEELEPTTSINPPQARRPDALPAAGAERSASHGASRDPDRC